MMQSALSTDANFWMLDPEVTFLNHGSFGSCPRPVLERQIELRNRLEREPVQFLVRELEPLWDAARTKLAEFVGAPPDDLVFVQNATAGVNTILNSLQFGSGDELLVTNQEYNATRNALNVAAQKWGAKVVVAEAPFPVQNENEIIEAIIAKVTARTRLALLDHVISQTALVFPLEKLVARLSKLGIECLIDGAHAPGMIPLNLKQLGATYYTGNCHKWLCAPKTSAFLYVSNEKQKQIRPLVISHGANSPRTDRSRFLIEFSWMGTFDPSACLVVPEALKIMGKLHPKGWPGLMNRNHELAVAGRKILAERLGLPLPCPEQMLGSMASLPLASVQKDPMATSPLYRDSLQEKLFTKYRIEVPVVPWPATDPVTGLQPRLIRISAQAYNKIQDYEKLANALGELL